MNKNGGDHGCIAYIPILDIVETRDIILLFRGMGMKADMYYNHLRKPVKQFFLV